MGDKGLLMPQALIIAIDVDPDHAEVRDLITAHLGTKLGWHVWHWFADLWLVTGIPSDLHPAGLSEELQRVTGDHPNILVFLLSSMPLTAGRVPPESMGWLYKFWENETFEPPK